MLFLKLMLTNHICLILESESHRNMNMLKSITYSKMLLSKYMTSLLAKKVKQTRRKKNTTGKT